MPILNKTQKLWTLFGLIVLMFASRFHHFGSVNFLPDASLAVFFLAGFYLSDNMRQQQPVTRIRWIASGSVVFTLLILIAALIDYIAINYGGVSDWCVTPAYLFLIPTYGIMYLAGRCCVYFNQLQLPGMLKTVAMLFAAVSLAFLISNGSFYLFSGRYAEMDGLLYAERVARYFPPYMAYTLLYAGLALTVQVGLIKGLRIDAVKLTG